MGAREKKALSESIARYGQVAEILVRPHPTQKQAYQIIDGQHRYEDLLGSGAEVVFVNVIELGDTDAKKLTLIANEVGGDLDAKLMNELVADLLEQLDGDMEELAYGLPFDAEDMAEFLIEDEELEIQEYFDLAPPVETPLLEPIAPPPAKVKPEKPPEPKIVNIPIDSDHFEYAYKLLARAYTEGIKVDRVLVESLERELGIVPDVF